MNRGRLQTRCMSVHATLRHIEQANLFIWQDDIFAIESWLTHFDFGDNETRRVMREIKLFSPQ